MFGLGSEVLIGKAIPTLPSLYDSLYWFFASFKFATPYADGMFIAVILIVQNVVPLLVKVLPSMRQKK